MNIKEAIENLQQLEKDAELIDSNGEKIVFLFFPKGKDVVVSPQTSSSLNKKQKIINKLWENIMKHHYGEEYVPRCSKWKKYADGTWRPKHERDEVAKIMKKGRRMARRKNKQDLKNFVDK